MARTRASVSLWQNQSGLCPLADKTQNQSFFCHICRGTSLPPVCIYHIVYWYCNTPPARPRHHGVGGGGSHGLHPGEHAGPSSSSSMYVRYDTCSTRYSTLHTPQRATGRLLRTVPMRLTPDQYDSKIVGEEFRCLSSVVLSLLLLLLVEIYPVPELQPI
jgi:hypothetical protein